jgi:hypothetical protein
MSASITSNAAHRRVGRRAAALTILIGIAVSTLVAVAGAIGGAPHPLGGNRSGAAWTRLATAAARLTRRQSERRRPTRRPVAQAGLPYGCPMHSEVRAAGSRTMSALRDGPRADGRTRRGALQGHARNGGGGACGRDGTP